MFMFYVLHLRLSYAIKDWLTYLRSAEHLGISVQMFRRQYAVIVGADYLANSGALKLQDWTL